MEDPKVPENLKFTELFEFLDQQLRKDLDWSIVDEYPSVFCESNRKNIRVIEENGKILSHAVWKPLHIKSQLGVFKIAAIGSVVTHEDYRQQGLSKKIIQECIDAAIEEDCDFAILWSDLYEFYQKMNFFLAGNELIASIDKRLEVEPLGLHFQNSNQVAPEAILKLFQKHSVFSMRSLEDVRRYLQIPNSRVYTAWHNNEIQAFAVEGKGADLNGYIHEWGGNVKPLLNLLNYIREDQARNLHMLLPLHSLNLLKRFQENQVDVHYGYLGLIRILKPQNLFSKIQRHASQVLGFNQLKMFYVDGEYRFQVQDKLFSTEKEEDIVRLLFGPQNPEELYDFSSEVSETLNRIFPLRMWIWGWDSI